MGRDLIYKKKSSGLLCNVYFSFGTSWGETGYIRMRMHLVHCVLFLFQLWNTLGRESMNKNKGVFDSLCTVLFQLWNILGSDWIYKNKGVFDSLCTVLFQL